MGNHSDIHTHSHRHSSSHTSVLRRPPSILSHTSSIHTILFTLTSTPHNRSDIHTHSHRHSSSHTSVLKRLPSILSRLTHLFHFYNLPTHSHLAGSLQPCTGTLTFCPVS